LFVSGDYTSATDNLTIDVAERLLQVFFAYVDFPTHIKEFAIRSLRVNIIDSQGNSWDHQRGQLMGSLLSFPLLCIQNYCAFRYYVSHEECPDEHVFINGDDICFYTISEAVFERWSAGVSILGLELSSGKTFTDSQFFSLNSTYFWKNGGKVGKVIQLPVVRFGLLKLCRGGEVGKNFNSFVRPVVGQLRWGAIQTFYRRHRKVLKKGRVSLCRQFPEGLGMKILPSELKDLEKGLLAKEREWFSRKDSGVPLVPSLNNFEVSPDYKFISVEHQLDQAEKDEQIRLFVDWHWSTDLKIGNSKERDFRYESNFRSRVMYDDSYVEAANTLGVDIKDVRLKSWDKAVSLLSGSRDSATVKRLLSEDHARIDREITMACNHEVDSTVSKVRKLVRRDRLSSVMKASVDLRRADFLDLAEIGGRPGQVSSTIASEHFRNKVTFESDGTETTSDVSKLLATAYRWKYDC